jgi:hypothetical protein
MEAEELIKEKKQQVGGFKVVKKGPIVETVNNLGQVFHSADLSYAQAGILYHSWNGFRSNDQLRDVLDGHMMDLCRIYRCKNIIMDCTKMRGSFSDLNDWLTKIYTPKLIAAGIKSLVIVIPEDIFAHLAVKDFGKKVQGINYRSFKALSEAFNWIALEQ